ARPGRSPARPRRAARRPAARAPRAARTDRACACDSPRGKDPAAEDRRSRRGAPGSGGAAGALAVHLGAQLLAQADRLWRHLDQLVVVNELQRLLERELDGRDQPLVLVLAGRAEVGQLLAAQCVDRQVVVLGVDADDLALVDLLARL